MEKGRVCEIQWPTNGYHGGQGAQVAIKSKLAFISVDDPLLLLQAFSTF